MKRCPNCQGPETFQYGAGGKRETIPSKSPELSPLGIYTDTREELLACPQCGHVFLSSVIEDVT